MRIISDFHDFYDAAQAAGQDPTVVYLRHKKEFELNRSTYPFPVFEGTPRFSFTPGGVSVVQFVVGFCGKIYPVLRLSHQRWSEPSPIVGLCHTLSDVDALIERNFKTREVETYRCKPRRRRVEDARWPWPRSQRRETFEEFFDACREKQSAFGAWFLDSRCPIFVASTCWSAGQRNREYKIVYNECLKDLEFFRVMDTYTAFQELQMYFGGMAPPNKPIPQVPDKDMVSVKGFDKWSFRKPPENPG